MCETRSAPIGIFKVLLLVHMVESRLSIGTLVSMHRLVPSDSFEADRSFDLPLQPNFSSCQHRNNPLLALCTTGLRHGISTETGVLFTPSFI